MLLGRLLSCILRRYGSFVTLGYIHPVYRVKSRFRRVAQLLEKGFDLFKMLHMLKLRCFGLTRSQ